MPKADISIGNSPYPAGGRTPSAPTDGMDRIKLIQGFQLETPDIKEIGVSVIYVW
jgi:hypothetical protein